MVNLLLQRVLNVQISLISPSHKLIKLRGEFCTLPSSRSRCRSSSKLLTTLTGLLEKIKRYITISSNLIILLLYQFSYIYFYSYFLILCIHILHYLLYLINLLFIITLFKLKVGKFICRVEGDSALVCWRSICKAKVFFKFEACSINSA